MAASIRSCTSLATASRSALSWTARVSPRSISDSVSSRFISSAPGLMALESAYTCTGRILWNISDSRLAGSRSDAPGMTHSAPSSNASCPLQAILRCAHGAFLMRGRR